MSYWIIKIWMSSINFLYKKDPNIGGFQILIYKVESWWQITPYKLRLCFKLKQNSYIYSTYTLPSRGTNLHATNGRGEMEWSCQKLRRVEKKSTTPYLRGGLLIFMRTVAHVFLLFTRKLFILFCPPICHALIDDECTHLIKVTLLTGTFSKGTRFVLCCIWSTLRCNSW